MQNTESQTIKNMPPSLAMRRALTVMVTDEKISRWLANHDPAALRQAREALGLEVPNLKERFIEWKESVLPEGVDTLSEVVTRPERWAQAWRNSGQTMVEATRHYRQFRQNGNRSDLPGAVETVRVMRNLLEETGIKCPPWTDFPTEDD